MCGDIRDEKLSLTRSLIPKVLCEYSNDSFILSELRVTAVLHEWLAPVSVATFVRLYWHKQSYARPAAAQGAVPILSGTPLSEY
jgi:hypothetical protein